MATRLKVFQTTLGFFDTIVAAPSQAKALEAFGVHQNLFAEGAARIIDPKTEPEAVAAALAQAGVPLKRPVGASGPFEAEPTALPEIPSAPAQPRPPRSAGKTTAKRRATLPPPPSPPPDRSRLDAAEARLSALRGAHADTLAGIEAERGALEARARRAAEQFERQQAEAAEAVERARRRYRDAGGRD